MPRPENPINRGSVYWANLNPSVGAEIQKIRPVIVLSVDRINQTRRTVIVVPLSTSAPVITGVNVPLTGGSVARCDQIRAIDKSRLQKKIGQISEADLRLLSQAIFQIMGLNLGSASV
jgi:mRNA interferase MazF